MPTIPAKTFDEKMAEAIAADERTAWQLHRKSCVDFAIRMGATELDHMAVIADSIGHYILHGKLPS